MNDIKKGWKLMFYGVSKKTSLICMVLFAAIGIVLEIMIAAGLVGQDGVLTIYASFDMGVLFLICAAMFPGQLVTSVDVSFLAQSSSYKRKLQSDIACGLTLIGSLIAMTLVVAVRMVVAALMPERAAAIMGSLSSAAIVAFCLILFSGVMYKFYVISLVILYIALLILSGFSGYFAASGGMLPFSSEISLPVSVSILFCYASVFAGCGVEFLLTRAAYKKPFSKYVFGSAVKKMLQS